MRKNERIDTVGRDDGYWFLPHLFGIGATPVTWQGWAVTLGFVALVMLDVRLLHERIAQVGVGVALCVLFTVIVIRTTRGGFGWRWGADT